MKRFSILITTRKRVSFLSNLLNSIYNTTLNKDYVEIRIVYDTDDLETDVFVKKFNLHPPIDTYFHSRERTINLVDDYHNWLSTNYAQGKYIIFSNDDALFEINGWDDKAWNKLFLYEQTYPDGILYGITEDFEKEPKRNKNNWMACFPLISKKSIEILGYAFDPEYIRDGADWALAATYRNIERIIDLRDCIVIRHLSFRSGRREWDILDEESRNLGISAPSPYDFVEKNRQKLLTYINQYKEIQKLKNEYST